MTKLSSLIASEIQCPEWIIVLMAFYCCFSSAILTCYKFPKSIHHFCVTCPNIKSISKHEFFWSIITLDTSLSNSSKISATGFVISDNSQSRSQSGLRPLIILILCSEANCSLLCPPYWYWSLGLRKLLTGWAAGLSTGFLRRTTTRSLTCWSVNGIPAGFWGGADRLSSSR